LPLTFATVSMLTSGTEGAVGCVFIFSGDAVRLLTCERAL